MIDLLKDGPRNIFPKVDSIRKYEDKRIYVSEVLLDLINENKLYLSECMVLPLYQSEIVGDVVLGLTYEGDDNRQAYIGEDPEISRWMVKIKNINMVPYYIGGNADGERADYLFAVRRQKNRGTKIEWINEPFDYVSGQRRIKDPFNRYPDRIRRAEAIMSEVPLGISNFPIREAWKILKKWGKYVRVAHGEHRQLARWKAEEIPPWVKDEDVATVERPEGIRKKGRPRRTTSVETA